MFNLYKNYKTDCALDSVYIEGYSSFFSVNTGFIFIKWYENKYLTNGNSHDIFTIYDYFYTPRLFSV